MKFRFFALSIAACLLTSPLTYSDSKLPVIRVGHFPNITHAPALIGRANGDFEKTFSSMAQIDWKLFNAGPQSIEALMAGEIDILYVGPNPAANGYARSNGEALRIIAGVSSGGSAFVVRPGSGIKTFEDIRRKRIATPQIGNSQDVALRHLMREKKLIPESLGGDVELFNLSGADQLITFQKNQIDAAWTVEPWVSRLEAEAGGIVLFDEKILWPGGNYATCVLVVRHNFLKQYPHFVKQWADTHARIVRWINQNPADAKRLVNEELKREIGKSLPQAYLDSCFKRISFTVDPMKHAVLTSAERALQIGFLGRKPVDFSNLFDLSFMPSKK